MDTKEANELRDILKGHMEFKPYQFENVMKKVKRDPEHLYTKFCKLIVKLHNDESLGTAPSVADKKLNELEKHNQFLMRELEERKRVHRSNERLQNLNGTLRESMKVLSDDLYREKNYTNIKNSDLQEENDKYKTRMEQIQCIIGDHPIFKEWKEDDEYSPYSDEETGNANIEIS